MTHSGRKNEISLRFLRTLIPGVLLALMVCPGVAQISNNPQHKNVLVVYDERDMLPGLAVLDQGLRSAFSSSASLEIDVYSESLDRSRFQEADYYQFLSDFFRRKYGPKRIDVIVAVMGPSLDFLLAHAEKIAPGTPIVFCGIDRREIEGRSLNPNVTGVLVKREFKRTLDVALGLQPNTREVVFVGGTSDFDKRLVELAKDELRPFEDRLAFRYLTDLALDDLLKEVSQLPPNTIVLASTMFRDGAGQAFVPHDVVSLISQKANVPVYGFVDQYIGRGIVGGHLYSVEAHGKKAAGLALRILEGEKVTDIPILEGDVSHDMFDWRELRRWGISEDILPAGSIVRFKEPSLWEQYKWHITGAITLSIVETFLIAWLLFTQKQRNAFQELAGAEHRRLDEILSNTPGIVWEALVDRKTGERRIHFVSDYIEKMLGYSVKEWLSTPNMGTSLVVEEDRGLVIGAMHAVVNEGQQQTVEYRWLAKNGKPRWVEAKVVPIRDETGKTIGLRGFTMDISDRKEAEEAVRQSESQFRLMADTTPVLIWVSDAEMLSTFFNRQCLDFTGRSMEELRGQGWLEIVHKDDRQRCLEAWAAANENRKTFVQEYRIRHADGEFRWIYAIGTPRFSSEGEFLGYIGSCVDITSLKLAEEKARRTEEQNSAIVAAIPDMIFLLDSKGVYLTVHAKDRDEPILPPDELLGKNICDVLPKALTDEFFRSFERAAETYEPQIVEYKLSLKDAVHWYEAHIVRMGDNFLSVVRDITRIKLAYEAVHDLSRRLMNAQEKERARLARELHDDLSQSIALLSVQLTILRNEPKDLEYVTDQLDQYIADVERLSGDVRRISHELHPAKLSQLGLEAALQGFCRELAAAHPLEIDFEAEDLPRNLPDDISLCLYRVAQESLQNVIKHSAATSAEVSIKTEHDKIRLSVSDNGKGFDPKAAKAKEALGLISIDERVRAVKGKAKIISAAGAGTKIEVRIPVNQQVKSFKQNGSKI